LLTSLPSAGCITMASLFLILSPIIYSQSRSWSDPIKPQTRSRDSSTQNLPMPSLLIENKQHPYTVIYRTMQAPYSQYHCLLDPISYFPYPTYWTSVTRTSLLFPRQAKSKYTLSLCPCLSPSDILMASLSLPFGICRVPVSHSILLGLPLLLPFFIFPHPVMICCHAIYLVSIYRLYPLCKL
jgi:hypothetical protein